VSIQPPTANVSVILPVRNMGPLAQQAIESILPQLGTDDRVIVVDDASDTAPFEPLTPGMVEVVRLTEQVGPYAARQIGAERADTDVLLFVDARCRALPGWHTAMVTPFASSDVAMACSDVQTLPGNSAAATAAHILQSFHTRQYLAHRFLPYFPTCNLAVRRTAFREVGGFRPIRSGGDADLCWRIQLAHLGRLVASPATTMTWVPRDSSAAFLEQWHRYGQGMATLECFYRDAGLRLQPVARTAWLHASRGFAIFFARHPGHPSAAVLIGRSQAAFHRGLMAGRAKHEICGAGGCVATAATS
jgi:cellulose synthase/poly-beta-1,6-N-acetylglucosamine synthase-like glycosyltransferase